MSQFNGIAYDAKIAFVDIGDMNKAIFIPDSLINDYFPYFHKYGARISSHSWSCSEDSTSTAYAQCNKYTSLAIDVDTFAYNNDDHLIIIAAGNSGAQGSYSVKTPSTAKNCISVASTMSVPQAWDYLCNVNQYISDCDLHRRMEGEGIALFSSRGWALPDMRIKPDLSMSGQYIISSRSNGVRTSSIGQCSATICRIDTNIAVSCKN
jgi:hypothetical protein